ncbi:MAG: fibronectin type III domain-containing protein [Proteobacteria bacterium]|nr:fibronectin type III domain-containing protein [Pseudomonadota bacterium]
MIADDGSFAIDVSDMKAPFILKASGTADGVSRTMFSFADKPGTANINPLSTVVVASAAGVDDPATVFDKPDAATLDKIKSGMPGSVSTLKSKLKLLLDDFSVANTDPVKDPFAADHTGLDGMFDNVKIVLNGGNLTVTNATTGAVIFTAQVRDVASGHFSEKDEDRPKPGPRPAAPANVKAVGGNAQVTVSWDPVANSTSYDLFYSTKAKVAEEEDSDDVDAKRVKNVTSLFVLKGLSASTTYSFIVRAINNGRRGPASAEISATTSGTTPVPTIPAAPTGLSATGGTKQATISWTAITGASTYNLYWSTTNGVTTTNGTKISGVTSPAVQTGLTDATTYFYIITAVNSAGESAASVQVAATTLPANGPPPAIPAAPTGATATGGASQATLAWSAVTGAASYNVYWSTTSGVTTTTGTRIAGVSSPYVQTGLTASTTYFYVVTALNSAGESGPSVQASATTSAPTATVPDAPAGVSATGGAKQVSVAWSAVSSATSYNLYWSAASGVTVASGTKVTGVSSPAVKAGLADNTPYFFIVTAVNSTGESAASAQVTATTSALPLDGVALYNANCSGCHGANGKRPRTAQQITDAIANVGSMQGISLTQAEIAAIAARP